MHGKNCEAETKLVKVTESGVQQPDDKAAGP